MGIKLNEKYRSGFLQDVEAAMRGETTFIPNFLGRVSEVFQLMQSSYTIIFGATGAGKTSFADYLFVLAPFTYLKTNDLDIHWEVVYVSPERKQKFKHAKWVSWFLYRDLGEQIAAKDLVGAGKQSLNEEGYATLRGYDDEISELLEHVHIYDGAIKADKLRRIINKRAKALGTFYYSDEDHVYCNDETVGTFSDEFVEATKTEDLRYLDLVHKNKTFRIYEEDTKYFMHNPKTFVFILLDGVGLFGSADFSHSKSTLDEVSAVLREARDYYGFSPVVVSQQNRGLSSTQRLKLHGSDLSPQLEDIQGSSQMAHDADLALALFDPFYFKALDQDGKYGGYDVLQGMMHPKGFSRFRSLHILKNSFGMAGKVYGLKFMGESNDFSVLPFPDSEEILKIYSDVAKGE